MTYHIAFRNKTHPVELTDAEFAAVRSEYGPRLDDVCNGKLTEEAKKRTDIGKLNNSYISDESSQWRLYLSEMDLKTLLDKYGKEAE